MADDQPDAGAQHRRDDVDRHRGGAQNRWPRHGERAGGAMGASARTDATTRVEASTGARASMGLRLAHRHGRHRHGRHGADVEESGALAESADLCVALDMAIESATSDAVAVPDATSSGAGGSHPHLLLKKVTTHDGACALIGLDCDLPSDLKADSSDMMWAQVAKVNQEVSTASPAFWLDLEERKDVQNGRLLKAADSDWVRELVNDGWQCNSIKVVGPLADRLRLKGGAVQVFGFGANNTSRLRTTRLAMAFALHRKTDKEASARMRRLFCLVEWHAPAEPARPVAIADALSEAPETGPVRPGKIPQVLQWDSSSETEEEEPAATEGQQDKRCSRRHLKAEEVQEYVIGAAPTVEAVERSSASTGASASQPVERRTAAVIGAAPPRSFRSPEQPPGPPPAHLLQPGPKVKAVKRRRR